MFAMVAPKVERLQSLKKPILVGIAKDNYLAKNGKVKVFQDPGQLGAGVNIELGQDVTYGHRKPFKDYDMDLDRQALSKAFLSLKGIFGSGDKTGVVDDVFSKFLSPVRSDVEFYSHVSLNSKASQHENIKYFCNAAANKIIKAISISQAAGMKNMLGPYKPNLIETGSCALLLPSKPITNLGVPAFNVGSKWRTTGDFDNGLGVLINGVQYAYIFLDKAGVNGQGAPKILLRYVFYDVFGLDDEDLVEYGTRLTSIGPTAGKGINAWWQLQHQHGCKPLITRIVLEKEYVIYNQVCSAKGIGYGFGF